MGLHVNGKCCERPKRQNIYCFYTPLTVARVFIRHNPFGVFITTVFGRLSEQKGFFGFYTRDFTYQIERL
jgi:hypothetical protein